MSHRKPRAKAETTRPDTPTLEGGDAPPEELTGRASTTDDNLVDLFGNPSRAHVADGFRGSSDDEPDPDQPDNAA